MSSQSAARQLVIISTIDWDFLWQRHHVWATEFAQAGWQVFFVENTGFRNPRFSDWSRLRDRLFRTNHAMEQPNGDASTNQKHDNITVVSPFSFPPNGWIFRLLNKLLLVPTIIKQMKKAGLTRPDLVLVYLPSWTTLQLLECLGNVQVVFDCVANFPAHPDCPPDYPIIEHQLLSTAMLVLTDSDVLYDYLSTRHKNVRQLHHGVDVERFGGRNDALPVPSQYRSICFFGAIDNRIDWDAVLALTHSDVRVYMIGDAKVPVPKGITVLPALNHQALARRLHDFDALIIPYIVNRFTEGIVPAKMYECMATGKPILTSNLPFVRDFTDVIYVCSTDQDYVNAFLNLSFTESYEKRTKRIFYAQSQSTTQNFRQLLEYLTLAGVNVYE